jgi:teichuronic acid biosynthesis glycosyltransferase TuaC
MRQDSVLNSKSLLVVTPDYPDKLNTHNIGNYVKRMLKEVAPSFKQVHVIAPVLPTMGLTPQSRFCQDYTYDNVSVYYPRGLYLPNLKPGSNSVWRNMFDLRYNAVKKVIDSKNLEFDLIHAQFAYMSGHIARKLHMQYKVPYIITVYEDPVWFDHLLNMGDHNYTSALRNAECVIGINSSDTNKLVEYTKRATHIPVGYDSQRFFCSTDMAKTWLRVQGKIPLAAKVVVSVGFLEKRKRFDVLIKAVASMNLVDRCYIIGNDKGELATLKQLIKDLGINDKVRIRTQIPDDRLRKYLAAADVVTVQSESEGFGITQVEAMACGTPVVASDNHGSRDVITPETGLLFDKQSIHDFRVKLNDALVRTWDADAVRAHAQRYRWSTISQEITTVHRKAITGNWS